MEPCFGQIKFGMGFRHFFYRGRQNVCAEWNLVCAAFHVKKIAASPRIKRGPPNPDPLTPIPFSCLFFVSGPLAWPSNSVWLRARAVSP